MKARVILLLLLAVVMYAPKGIMGLFAARARPRGQP